MKVVFHGTGHYSTGATIGPAGWPHWDLLIVARGRISLQTGRQQLGREFVMEEGSAVILAPGVRFRGRGETPQTSIWVIHFDHPSRPAGKAAQVFPHAVADPFARGLMTEFALVYGQDPSRSHSGYLQSLLAALLEKIQRRSRQKTRYPAVDTRLHWWRIEDLESRTDQPFPTVESLAASAGLSVSHHRAKFKSQYDVSPGHHLTQLRITYARKLLRETRIPIKQVASRTGYKDVVSFHRAFTATCGSTPGRFRKDQPLVA